MTITVEIRLDASAILEAFDRIGKAWLPIRIVWIVGYNPQRLLEHTYQCMMCEGVFGYGWSSEEALDELKQTFGDIPTEQCGIVCDDCYKAMGFDDGEEHGIEVVPTPEFDQAISYADAIMRSIAQNFGISYEQLSKDFNNGRK